MEVEVQAVPGCPGLARAVERTREALVALGRDDVTVRTVLIETQDQADRLGFAGSPSIVADGRELLPGGVPGSLACRLYRDGARFSNAPSAGAIAAALGARLSG